MSDGGARRLPPLVTAVGCPGLTVLPARRDRIGSTERAVLAAVNGLPDALHRRFCLWVVQAGVRGALRRLLRAREGPLTWLAVSGTAPSVVATGIQLVVPPGTPKGPRRRPVRGDEAWVRSSGRLDDANSGAGPRPRAPLRAR